MLPACRLSLSKPLVAGAGALDWVSGSTVMMGLRSFSDGHVRGALGDAEVSGASGSDELDDLAVVDVLRGDVRGHTSEVERGDPVGDLEDVAHVVRDQHDAEAAV